MYGRAWQERYNSDLDFLWRIQYIDFIATFNKRKCVIKMLT